MSALKESAETLVGKLKDVRIAVFSPYDVLWKELSEIAETPNDFHAGEMETSIMLHLAPELVKGRSPEEYPKIPKPFVVRDKVKYWPGGVWGDPQKASADKGKKAIKLMVERIAEIIGQVEKPF
jgi:creatinine amidohydrolase